ncbi:MAG: hypothetical protein FH756_19740 [Firmicutes bacterium]|nr:hypothetical protein [Bacillota bacterium]
MVILAFSSLAILSFALFANTKRVKEFLPVIMTGVFLRFLEHYIVVDWLRLWTVKGSHLMHLWLPIITDLTVWPVACYFYLQYLPRKRILLYGAIWAGIMLTYLICIHLLGVFGFRDNWNWGITIIVLCAYFSLINVTWKWLQNRDYNVTDSAIFKTK